MISEDTTLSMSVLLDIVITGSGARRQPPSFLFYKITLTYLEKSTNFTRDSAQWYGMPAIKGHYELKICFLDLFISLCSTSVVLGLNKACSIFTLCNYSTPGAIGVYSM